VQDSKVSAKVLGGTRAHTSCQLAALVAVQMGQSTQACPYLDGELCEDGDMSTASVWDASEFEDGRRMWGGRLAAAQATCCRRAMWCVGPAAVMASSSP